MHTHTHMHIHSQLIRKSQNPSLSLRLDISDEETDLRTVLLYDFLGSALHDDFTLQNGGPAESLPGPAGRNTAPGTCLALPFVDPTLMARPVRLNK